MTDYFAEVNLRNALKRNARIRILLKESIEGINEVINSLDDPNKEYRTYVIENLNEVLERIEKARNNALRNDIYSVALKLTKED